MGGGRVAADSLVGSISVGSVVGSVAARRLNPARLAGPLLVAGPLPGEARSSHHGGVPSEASILGKWCWQWLWQDHLEKRKVIPFKLGRWNPSDHKKANTLGL